MQSSINIRAYLMAVIMAVVFCPAAQAQSPGMSYMELTPATLKWTENPAVKGVYSALMIGDPAKPGPFVYRAKFPAGYKTPANSHVEDRMITVISGTLYVGNGDVFDEKKMHALPPGSFYTVPKGVNHFVWAKDEVVLQVQGTGPVGVKFAEPAKR
jgi:quercetin dioxygenase-like cupin family protein